MMLIFILYCPALHLPFEILKKGRSLPGGSPVMSRTVQQGAHVCLVSPSNVDDQHACETKNRVSFTTQRYNEIPGM